MNILKYMFVMVLLIQHLFSQSLQNPQEFKQDFDSADKIPEIAYIEEFILSAYRQNYADFELEKITLNIPKSILQNASFEIKKLNLPNGTIKKTSGTLIATISQGKSLISVPISYHINANILVAQARLAIKTGTDLTQQNTFTQWVNLSNIKGNPLPPNEIGNVSARSLIAPNSIITRDKVQDRILIRKGDKIIGIYNDNSMQAQIALKALQNGSKGSIIKAQNIQSGKILHIKITDEGIGEIL